MYGMKMITPNEWMSTLINIHAELTGTYEESW